VAIAAEALRNAVLHAQAGTIELAVDYRRRELVLRISDDGIGIAPPCWARAGGPGIMACWGCAKGRAGSAPGSTCGPRRAPAPRSRCACPRAWPTARVRAVAALAGTGARAARWAARIRRCLPGW
jgi:hypothetical protein